MGENSAIEWCDHTFNPWVGCTKVSPGCDNCYAEGWARRSGLVLWNGPPRRTSESAWRQPRKWNSEARKAGVRKRVFCASLGDVFDNQVPEKWRCNLWELITECRDLDWLLLTKRPQNMRTMLPQTFLVAPWPHVWLGTTVENQTEANRRIPILLDTPAARRFVSCEPLLQPMKLTRIDIGAGAAAWWDAVSGLRYWGPGAAPIGPHLDWVIAGGESGLGARPMHPDWPRSLRDQCAEAGVPFYFKQWGEWAPYTPRAGGDLGGDVRAGRVNIVHPTGQSDVAVFIETGGRSTISGSRYMACVGKKAAGALLDGREWRQIPGADYQA